MFSAISLIAVWMFSDFIGTYDERWKEIVSMNMVAAPLIVILSVVLESFYQYIK